MTLPIDAIADDVRAAVSRGDDIVVHAPTGSGKSTRLPVWMAERVDGLVYVIEPRRLACRALAEYLRKTAPESIRSRIGYHVRGEARFDGSTRLLFLTPGMALQRLAGERSSAGAWVLDEFHERSWQTDLALALIRRRQSQVDWRVAVTSATLDIDGISSVLDATVLRAEGRTFAVEIEYDESVTAPTSRDLAERVRHAVERSLSNSSDDGDVLVFLPGKGEIADAEGAVAGIAKARNLDVLPLHSRSHEKVVRRALSATSARRRLYLATNVAETSLTLPGVTTVIDAGLVRQRRHQAGRSVLALGAVSQASADQRAGRAGRVRAGRCVRLWSQRHRLEPHVQPEIVRDELDELVLAAAAGGVSVAELSALPWVTEPPPFAVETAAERLTERGLLTGEGAASSAGARAFGLPIAPELARAIIETSLDCRHDVIDAVAVAEAGRGLVKSLGELAGSQDRVEEARREVVPAFTDELSLSVTLLRADQGGLGLDARAKKRVLELANDLRRRFELPRCERDTRAFDVGAAAMALGRALPDRVYASRERATGKRARRPRWTNGEGELELRPWEPRAYLGVRLDDEWRDPKLGVVLEVEWLGSRTLGARGVGGMVAPLSARQATKLGVGEVEAGRVRKVGKGERLRIVAETTRQLGGVVLERSEEKLEGERLLETMTSMILRGQLRRDLRDAVLDALHHHTLLSKWPELPRGSRLGEWSPGADPATHLWAALRQLGIASAGDLSLVESEDLAMPSSVTDWVDPLWVERLYEDFPRVWEHLGAEYEVDVRPRLGRVTLRPANSSANSAKDPSKKVVPSFRGFAVFYEKASRKIRIR